VDRLPLRERTALTLRFQRELTQTEIADVLGVSQIQVARSLRRALERLRALEALNRTAAAAPERQ
jgi:RNA polymerase sigma factor (sigma-70 family)